MLLIMVQWFGMLCVSVLVGWLLFRFGLATWDEDADTAECEGIDGSGASCCGGSC